MAKGKPFKIKHLTYKAPNGRTDYIVQFVVNGRMFALLPDHSFHYMKVTKKDLRKALNEIASCG